MFSSSKIRILHVKPSETEFSDFIELYHKQEEDLEAPIPPPSIEFVENWLSLPIRLESKRIYLLAQDYRSKTPAGILTAWINIGKSNRHLSSVNIYVLPETRKMGLAKRLLNSIWDLLPDEVTTIQLGFWNKEDSNSIALSKTMSRYGGKFTFKTKRSVCYIQDFDKQIIINKANKYQEKARSKGYEYILIENGQFEEQFGKWGFTYKDYLYMLENVVNDMPREESSWSDEVITPENHQYNYKYIESLGQTTWTVVVVDQASSKPVAMTDTWLYTDRPTIAFVGDTGVIKNHRGNNLGLSVKYQMLVALLTRKKSQQINSWMTHNAYSNKHMIRINENMGYKEISIYNSYEFDRNSLKTQLNE